MKTSRLLSVFAAVVVSAAFAFAAEKEKEITITGMGQCAKCSLNQTESCQNAVVVKEGGKDVTYLLAENDVSKKIHDELCDSAKEIRVIGVVKDNKGQKEIVASKVELVKKAS